MSSFDWNDDGVALICMDDFDDVVERVAFLGKE